MENPWLKDDHESVYAPCRKCAACGEDVADDEKMYEVETCFWVCDECFREHIEDMDSEILAGHLGIDVKESRDIE